MSDDTDPVSPPPGPVETPEQAAKRLEKEKAIAEERERYRVEYAALEQMRKSRPRRVYPTQ